MLLEKDSELNTTQNEFHDMDAGNGYPAEIDKISNLYIVDDDEIMVYLSRHLIDENNFCEHYEIFNRGEDALTHIRKVVEQGLNLPDALLVDIHMPEMSGWEFLDELAKIPGSISIPIFIFSSSAEMSNKNKLHAYPFVKGYIQKPLTIIKLKKIMRLIS